MTVQAAEARTAIGSGLLYHGLERGSKIGLYSVNCRGNSFLKLCPWAPKLITALDIQIDNPVVVQTGSSWTLRATPTA